MKVNPSPIPSWKFSFIKAFDFAPSFCRAQQQTVLEQNKGQGGMVRQAFPTGDSLEAHGFSRPS